MKQYTIRQGRHYCRGWWKKVFHPHWDRKSWEVSFVLPEEAWWSPPRDGDKNAQNKIWGQGFGLFHHRNSWRITFVPIWDKPGYVNLFAYIYDDWKRLNSVPLFSCRTEEEVYILVERGEGMYTFYRRGLEAIGIPNKAKDCKLQFDLYPYVGGENPAIKTMEFYIDAE